MSDKWDAYFYSVAVLTSDQSSCSRRHYGAVLVRDRQIISTGYNGTPIGYPNCDEGGCARCNDPFVESGKGYEYCACVHAEANAILLAARQGIATNGATLYVSSDLPCPLCLKELLQAGVEIIVNSEGHRCTTKWLLQKRMENKEYKW